MGFATYLLGRWAWTIAYEYSITVGLILAGLTFSLGIMTLMLAFVCIAFFLPTDTSDSQELRPSPRVMKGLLRLVRQVARKQSLPIPDEVRLHATSTAHVYEEKTQNGYAKILVIGAPALASLDRKALAGVVAHELGHFAGGDTKLLRRTARWHRTMMHVEYALMQMPWNPLGWMIRLYHWLFKAAWAKEQRKREVLADEHEVEVVGAKQAAQTLIAISTINEMPWSRLSSVAEWFAVMRTRDASIFREQVRRARQTTSAQWQDACRRALKQKTKSFDSHPCLRDRLRAIGISPKQAIALAGKLRHDQSDPADYIDDWDEIDNAISAFFIDLVQQNQQAKRDMAAVILGRHV